MNLVDVTHRLWEPDLLDILVLSVGYPTPEKLRALAGTYAREPSWSARALFAGDSPLGVIGLERLSPSSVRIRHIAVAREAQRSGIGSSMIEDVQGDESLAELLAETDSDAVGFYERLGFTVRQLDAGRFECRWSRS